MANTQGSPPTFDYESLLDTKLYPSGVVGLGAQAYNLVFAPPPPLSAAVTLAARQGGKVASFAFLPEYRLTSQVFAQVQVEGPAEINLPAPDLYELQFYVGGQPAGLLRFQANRPAATDPFAPATDWNFRGPWSSWGYLIGSDWRDFSSGRDFQAVNLVWWAGDGDLAPGQSRAGAMATLRRGGTVVAHSKRQSMTIHRRHYVREQPWTLFHPHEDRQSQQARALSMEELLGVDGEYELQVSRAEDEHVIRRFVFQVRGNAWVPHPRTVPGYQPAHGFIAPRVVRKQSNVYEFTEVRWIESRN